MKGAMASTGVIDVTPPIARKLVKLARAVGGTRTSSVPRAMVMLARDVLFELRVRGMRRRNARIAARNARLAGDAQVRSAA